MVVIIMLGEHAHAHLVEGSVFEVFQRLLHQRVVLMGQGVHRGAEGDEQRAVFIFKMGIHGFYQAMGIFCCFTNFRTLCIYRTCDFPMPFPGNLRQEADDIPAFAVIKAFDSFDAVTAGKRGRQIDPRPAVRQCFARKNKLEHLILLHRRFTPYSNSSRLHCSRQSRMPISPSKRKGSHT